MIRASVCGFIVFVRSLCAFPRARSAEGKQIAGYDGMPDLIR